MPACVLCMPCACAPSLRLQSVKPGRRWRFGHGVAHILSHQPSHEVQPEPEPMFEAKHIHRIDTLAPQRRQFSRVHYSPSLTLCADTYSPVSAYRTSAPVHFHSLLLSVMRRRKKYDKWFRQLLLAILVSAKDTSTRMNAKWKKRNPEGEPVSSGARAHFLIREGTSTNCWTISYSGKQWKLNYMKTSIGRRGESTVN